MTGNYLIDGDDGSHYMSPYYNGSEEIKAECNECKVYFSEDELIDIGGWNNFHCKACHEELKQINN